MDKKFFMHKNRKLWMKRSEIQNNFFSKRVFYFWHPKNPTPAQRASKAWTIAQSGWIFMILLFVIAVLIVSCRPTADNKEVPAKEPKNGEKTGLGGITREQCEQAGGNWNECGSPCAGTIAEMCIQVCQAQCECGGIVGFDCPDGYKCRLSGNIADEMGACIKE